MKEFLVKEIFDKATVGSRNVRTLQVTIATCCIIVFIALYNSFQSGWIENRLKIHECQLKYQTYIIGDSVPPQCKNDIREYSKFEDAKKYYDKHYYTPEILRHQYVNLLKSKNDNVLLVKMPFFNTVFDINDLAFMSGLAFFLILIIAIYTLHMKKNRLIVVADFLRSYEQETFEKKLAYYLFMTNQILTINTGPFQTIKFVKHLPSIVYYMPLTVYIFVLLHDVLTFDLGSQISNTMTIISYGFSLVFLIFIIILTVLIQHASTLIDDVWKGVQAEFETFNP